ncbi:MAG TPA: methyltransferase domain-containing protein [Gemmatimonadaceae bacterium]
MTALTPARRRGVEILDDPSVDPGLMRRSMRDVERANTYFGGRRAALAELDRTLKELPSGSTFLDVGTGRGDIAAAVKTRARELGKTVRTIGIDMSLPLIEEAKAGNDLAVRGNALALPFRNSSVDVVFASQVLHHFPEPSAVAMVREMNRVARRRVVISDLRRSVVAATGLWVGSFLLGFHPVSRHDGVVSVMRGFLPFELEEIVVRATGKRPIATRRLGFRLTTSWVPVP